MGYKLFCAKTDDNNRLCGNSWLCPEHTEDIKQQWISKLPDLYRDSSMDDFNDSKAIAEKTYSYFKSSKNSLYIYGDLGTGKTRLLYAIAKYLIKMAVVSSFTQKEPFIIEDCKAMPYKFQYYYLGKGNCSLDEHILSYGKMSKLYTIMLDDMGHGGTNKDEFTLNTYNLLIDTIYENNGKLIITSNHSLEQLINYIGRYAVDRLVEMCGDNILNIKTKSFRIL